MQILIVEDSEIFRSVLRATISAQFPHVDILETGTVASGIRTARQHSPDLVLVDIQLPDGSGMPLAGQLVKEFPKALVAICTSYDTPEYRESAAAYGIPQFIPKDEMSPCRVLDLVEESLLCEVC